MGDRLNECLQAALDYDKKQEHAQYSKIRMPQLKGQTWCDKHLSWEMARVDTGPGKRLKRGRGWVISTKSFQECVILE